VIAHGKSRNMARMLAHASFSLAARTLAASAACIALVSLRAPPLQAAPLDVPALHALQFAEQQLTASVAEVNDPTRFPRSTLSDGSWRTEDSGAWTSGFFPGCLWLKIGRAHV